MSHRYLQRVCPNLGINFLLALFLVSTSISYGLDKTKINQWYFDGEFEKVRDSLETYRKSGELLSRDDSIYVYKHLSVVYAAKEESREKAESYMYQLLKLVPTIDLIDMYISDNIESIFNKVKERYQRLNQEPREKENLQAADLSNTSAATQMKLNKSTPASGPKKNKSWIWWTAGGTGVAALVTLFIISGSNGDSPTQTTYELDL